MKRGRGPEPGKLPGVGGARGHRFDIRMRPSAAELARTLHDPTVGPALRTLRNAVTSTSPEMFLLKSFGHAVRQAKLAYPGEISGVVVGSALQARVMLGSDIDPVIYIDKQKFSGDELFEVERFIIRSYSSDLIKRIDEFGSSKLDWLKSQLTTLLPKCRILDIRQVEPQGRLFLSTIDSINSGAAVATFYPELVFLFAFHVGGGNDGLTAAREAIVRQFAASPHGEKAWMVLMNALMWKEEGRREAYTDLPSRSLSKFVEEYRDLEIVPQADYDRGALSLKHYTEWFTRIVERPPTDDELPNPSGQESNPLALPWNLQT